MESESPGEGGTLLVLEPKSLRSFTSNDEYLYAMKEDLADWFSCLYKLPMDADSFLSILETGVLLCRHANEVQHIFKEQTQQPGSSISTTTTTTTPQIAMRSYFIRSVPQGQVTCRNDVKPGTFQARDNVSNFIAWCRQLGIPDVLRFETDDLVMRKNEKSVILCLLELARVGAKLGMLAPTLVQMEQEIDQELESDRSGKPPPQVKTCDMRTLDDLVRELVGDCTCPVQFPMVKVGEGKYQIGDSRALIFVRVLRNHVMVRVGGGWDTLENYLDKHDPCRCHFKGHRGGLAANTGPRHQIRRSSTSGLIATRATANPTPPPSQGPFSPRKTPGTSMTSSPSATFVKGSSPGPAQFSKGPSPARSSSATSNTLKGSNQTSGTFRKGPSPVRSKSPTPVSNGTRRLPSPASSHSLGELKEQRNVRDSVGRLSSSTGIPRSSSPALGVPSTKNPNGQQRSREPSPPGQQLPQHQALQRCKSPSPSSGPRCVSPAVSGNRSLPRPVSRGASGIPRPMSPACDSTAPARRQAFNVSKSVSFDTATGSSTSDDTLGISDLAEEQNQSEGGASVSQISTMTLSELRQLVNQTNTTQTADASEMRLPKTPRDSMPRNIGELTKRAHSTDPDTASWKMARELARSKSNTDACPGSDKKSTGGKRSANILVRRSQPKSAVPEGNSSKTAPPDRPKTPSAVGTERPRTPASTYRPKTPVTSPYTPRPKTPSRPKTPTASISHTKGQPPSALSSTYTEPLSARTESKTTKATGLKLSRSLSFKETRPARSQNSAVGVVEDMPSPHCVTSSASVCSRDSDLLSVEQSDSEYSHQTSVSFGSAVLASPDENESLRSHDYEEESSPVVEEREGHMQSVSESAFRDRPQADSRLPKPVLTPRATTPGLTGVNTSSSGKKSGLPTASRIPDTSSRRSGRSAAERQPSEGEDIVTPTATPRTHIQSTRSATRTPSRLHAEMPSARQAQHSGLTKGSSSVVPSVKAAGRSTGVEPSTPRSGVTTPRRFNNNTASRTNKVVGVDRGGRSQNLPETIETDSEDFTDTDDNVLGGSWTTQQTPSSDSQHHSDRPGNCVTECRCGLKSCQSRLNTQRKMSSRNQVISSPRVPAKSVTFHKEPLRSKTPGPEVGLMNHKKTVIKNPSRPEHTVGGFQNRTSSRTAAWVDSTLNDPKRKQQTFRSRRPMTPNSLTLAESALLSRPLEEIRASLPSPKPNPELDPDTVEAAPDPEMYKKMELLFEKYREMELRALVRETPGGGRGFKAGSSISSRSSSSQVSSEEPEEEACNNSASSLSLSNFRRTNSPENSPSFSSAISSAPSQEADSSRGMHMSVEKSASFSKESSPAVATTALVSSVHSDSTDSRCENDHSSQTVGSPACNSATPGEEVQTNSPAVPSIALTAEDAEMASHSSTALASKIKEILHVSTRKEVANKPAPRSRIPTPVSFSQGRSSKSGANRATGSVESRPVAAHEAKYNGHDETSEYRRDITGQDTSVGGLKSFTGGRDRKGLQSVREEEREVDVQQQNHHVSRPSNLLFSPRQR